MLEDEFDASLSCSETPTTGAALTQAQTPVKYNVPVYVNLLQQINIKKSENESPSITSCTKIGTVLVFTDCNNDRLITCNTDGSDINHIQLSYRPYYVTKVDSNSVAVSCLDDKIILIINISTGSVISAIYTNGHCLGISYDYNLYVIIGLSKIQVMDLTGKVKRTIRLPSVDIHDITVERDRVVCIDNDSIYCCSSDGSIMLRFRDDKYQDLCCVTSDDEGNVYETDGTTNTVVVVSVDRKHCRELLNKSDGLEMPCGIFF